MRLKKDKKYRKALEKISELRPAVDFFFDKVHVMAEDQEIRKNRIALLGTLLKEFSTIADFSVLGSEDSKAPCLRLLRERVAINRVKCYFICRNADKQSANSRKEK